MGCHRPFVRHWRRSFLCDAVDDECMSDCSDVLSPPSSECALLVLWLKLVMLDDELESSGSLLGTVRKRSKCVVVRSTDVVAAGAVGALSIIHGLS